MRIFFEKNFGSGSGSKFFLENFWKQKRKQIFFEQKFGSGSRSRSSDKNLEAEAEAFLENKTKMEAEAEANFFSKKFWKRKQIFFEKKIGSGSALKINRLQHYNIVLYSPTTGAPPNLIWPLKKIDEVDHPKFIALFRFISIIPCAPKFA